MWRALGSILGGLVAWAVVATILNFALRALLPDYHAAEATLQFTLAMKMGRLALAAVASLCAGVVVRLIAPDTPWSPWVAGLLILGMFVPVHLQLWSKFPVWYHLTFLLSLVPLVALGASLTPRAVVRRSVA